MITKVFSRVSDETAIGAGRVIASVSMLAAIASVALVVALGEFRLWYEEWGLQNALAGFLFSLLLFTVVSRQPRNGALWAVGWSGALQSVTMALTPALVLFFVRNEYGDEAVSGFRTITDPTPEIHFLIWLMDWTFIPALGLFMTFGFLLFPDGRLPSRRWRAVAWLATLSIGGATIGMMTETDIQSLDGRSLPPITAVLLPVIALAILASIGSLRFRYRRAGGDERHQLRWLAYGASILCVPFLATSVIDSLSPTGWSGTLARPTSLIALPFLVGAYAVALFKYRLYDIDVVISKSVAYLGLAAVISALYAAVVVGPLLIIGRSDDGGPGLFLPIVATAVVAMLFEPVRSRMQRWANRLVFGERASPHDVLSRVTARLSEAKSGPDDLARLLAEGTGAEQAVVWLRTGDVLQAEGLWSGDSADLAVPLITAELISDEYTEAVAIRHEDVSLGALSIAKPLNDPLTPADRELLIDVAAGAGLLLRNIRLNRQLEERADEVRVSRRRLIAAQDRERHRLERDLHDGAQQQVVALKVKLGIAKTVAEREGADEIALRIVELAEEAQDAVDALRAVAHGIYPPLLESEGLEPALRAIERTSSIPLQIEMSGLSRYTRPVEETTYFCVTETLERARMSGASSARVAMADHKSDLIMEIDLHDRRTELDLTAVSDRLDAVGGAISVEEQSGSGTQITGFLPAVESALEGT